MSSNGKLQFGGWLMGDNVNNCFNFSNAARHESSKAKKGMSLASRLHKGLETLLKSLMKRR